MSGLLDVFERARRGRVPRAWWDRSIAARIAAVSLGLLLVIQVASFGAIRVGLAEHARRTLPTRLEVGQRVLMSLVERQTETLRQGAAVLAADYGFKTAVLSNDAETIASALANHGARIGAAEAALLSTDFSIRASTGDAGSIAGVVADWARYGIGARGAATIAVIGGRPHRVVLTPMKAPVTVGWVLMGFPIDHRLVDDMRSLSGLDLTVLVRSGPEGAWTVATTGEPEGRARAFAAAVPAAGTADRTPTTTMRELSVGGERFGVRALPFAPAVLGLVSISIDDAIRLPLDLQVGLAVITLLGFGVFVFGSIVTAQRLTGPLRRLTAAAERLGRGDFDVPMRGLRRVDEIGQLASAFERMRVGIGEKQAQVERLAYWDGLTGLPNRARFLETVHAAIERDPSSDTAPAPADEARRVPPEAGIAIVMLNLDRFKHVNDILGYRVGDLLLQRVAERLGREVVRGDDMVARLGGDEFAVLLRGADPAAAQAVAVRIALAFDVPLVIEDHTVDMGAGIGIACWPADAADADTLIGHAELAMYAAKRRAQGPLAYDPSFDATSAMTLSLLTDLRRAVEQGELRLYLQPKIALRSGEVHAAEALVRWSHPTRGLVPPGEFIPFAEQTGFIRTMTLWVFEEAARRGRRLAADDTPLTISVNLSTRDLLDIELPQKFQALLARHGVPAERLCLEITESAIMDDPQRSLATLDRLSALGFALSIDDFGTGYSSLAYLKRLPVDELKIDRSFVMNLVTDADDAMIVRSTIDLAHNLGLRVVAEGVENAAVLDALRRLGCDEAQGYHMGRPMPADDFAAWSAGWAARRQPVAEAALTD